MDFAEYLTSDFPPTAVVIAGNDLCRDSNEQFVKALQKHGVFVRSVLSFFYVIPGF